MKRILIVVAILVPDKAKSSVRRARKAVGLTEMAELNFKKEVKDGSD